MLFYYPHIREETHITLSVDESKHLIRVLRKREGEQIQITNGEGLFASAIITKAHDKQCELTLESKAQQAPPSPYVHIAIAPTKNMDRMEWMVEKLTEIGVREISFIITSNSERKVLKLERLTKKAISALKQSGNCYLPKLNDLETLDSFLSVKHDGVKKIAWVEEKKESAVLQSTSEDKITLLIGPEGDFSQNEVNKAQSHGFTPVGLGQRVLRTETAALVGASVLLVK